MAQKAILITAGNRDNLAKRFSEEHSTGPALAIGYYLVSGFGDHLSYEIISAANFAQIYERGPDIRNGFFEAVKK